MGSATAQLVGNVATELKKSLENAGHERVSFRVISTERRPDGAGGWIDGDQFAVSVVCWGALARNVAQSVHLGEPVLVSGRLSTRKYEADGEVRYLTELRATQVGHDLARGRSVFSRSSAGVDAASEGPAENTGPSGNVGATNAAEQAEDRVEDPFLAAIS
jgi:single-strand DNA-binding protein